MRFFDATPPNSSASQALRTPPAPAPARPSLSLLLASFVHLAAQPPEGPVSNSRQKAAAQSLHSSVGDSSRMSPLGGQQPPSAVGGDFTGATLYRDWSRVALVWELLKIFGQNPPTCHCCSRRGRQTRHCLHLFPIRMFPKSDLFLGTREINRTFLNRSKFDAIVPAPPLLSIPLSEPA